MQYAAARPLPASRRFRCTSSSETAAGVTPGMRAACPSVAGLVLGESLPYLVRQAAHRREIEPGRQRRLFVATLPLDLLVLPLDVAAVLRLHVDLQRHLHGQPFV